MIYNQLKVRPTDETLAYMSSVMSGSPLDLNIENYNVVIVTTLDACTAVPNNLYQAQAISVKVWYDAYLQRSSLIMSLESTDLQRRALQLNQEGVLRQFYDRYHPYLTIRPDMPSLSRNYKSFVLQAANAFCSNSRPLEFTGEYLEVVEYLAPPNFEYNEAMDAEQLVRRNY